MLNEAGNTPSCPPPLLCITCTKHVCDVIFLAPCRY